mmetsp:Transcript_44018/g.42606  ORF Transcript_44018/g.42606 Transcript_44018/m.42606 type:complete len:86 (+) Transcript_44018:877-1134(+)
MIIGIALSFWYSWRTALVTLGISPFMMLGGILRMRVYAKEHAALKNDPSGTISQNKMSNALLSDIIINYRTVIGFGPSNINSITG